MKEFGRAHKFGNNINTDYIIPAKRKRDTLDLKEMSKYLLEDIAPGFRSRIQPGDFLVAGSNFGCGSSREVAPLVIIYSGIQAVVAKSFARIFYRNAINTGLILFECDTDSIQDGDLLRLNYHEGHLHNVSKGLLYESSVFPKIMLDIIQSDGLVNYMRKKGEYSL